MMQPTAPNLGASLLDLNDLYGPSSSSYAPTESQYGSASAVGANFGYSDLGKGAAPTSATAPPLPDLYGFTRELSTAPLPLR
jgi:hypothetical protein